jgi:hypothetical protein
MFAPQTAFWGLSWRAQFGIRELSKQPSKNHSLLLELPQYRSMSTLLFHIFLGACALVHSVPGSQSSFTLGHILLDQFILVKGYFYVPARIRKEYALLLSSEIRVERQTVEESPEVKPWYSPLVFWNQCGWSLGWAPLAFRILLWCFTDLWILHFNHCAYRKPP